MPRQPFKGLAGYAQSKEIDMRKTQKGDTIKVHFRGTLDDGTEFARTSEGEPIQFTIGEGLLIKGFEDQTIGMTPGESKTIRLEVEDAFGPKRDELISTIPRSSIPDHIELSVGLQLKVKSSSGDPLQVEITAVDEDEITVDANPPLVGQPLNFNIELVEFA
jgi:FKBP-type peptidyl-prolyl cis-trans isomerase 2